MTGTTTSGKSEEFLKLNPTLDGPQVDKKTESSSDPKVYTNRQDETYTGMPIVPLNPDVATSETATSPATASGTTAITDKAGISDKVWKETPLDDISRSGAPGAGPSAPENVTPAVPASSSTAEGDAAIKTSAPDAVTAGSSTYPGSGTSDKTPHTHGVDAAQDSAATKTTENTTASKTQDSAPVPPNRDTPDWATPDVAKADSDNAKPSTDNSRKWTQKARQILSNADGIAGLADEKVGRKSETGKSPALGNTTSNEEKNGKMSHLKEKLKDKLHIGHKDK